MIPETIRIFDQSPYQAEFTAKVLSCQEGKKGYEIILDQTCFFPEEGGQSPDTGTIQGHPVLDVKIKKDVITHFLPSPLEEGSEISGRIDWAHRFSNMQQHSGEHIVTGLIHKHFGYDNVGFHLSDQTVTLDMNGVLTKDELEQIETEANEVVAKNLPTIVTYPSKEELKTIEYRSKIEIEGQVRLVTFPGVDTCACCAPHVARTGEIGMIKILSCVKFHQGVRMELVCGKRAYTTLCAIYEQNRMVSQAFSAKPMETGEAARKMNDQLSAEKLRATGLEKRLFGYISEGYVNQSCALHFAEGLSSAAVRELADRIADRVTGWAAVLSGSDQEGYSLCIVSRHQDVKALGTQAVNALCGRGGGKSNCFQGSLKAEKARISAFFKEHIQ